MWIWAMLLACFLQLHNEDGDSMHLQNINRITHVHMAFVIHSEVLK
jgi:hypothetical protein